MNFEIINVEANGMTFYVERRGAGPVVVLVPSGNNDCGPLKKVAEILAEDFTVVTFDMRGGTRSMPLEDVHVTPKLLADDITGIVKVLGNEKVTLYGCSSGGQAVLAVGKYHPEIVKNIIAYEAALQAETPIPMIGLEYFKTVNGSFGPLCKDFSPMDIYFLCDWNKWKEAVDEETQERINRNNEYWSRWYLGTVDSETYFEEDLKGIKLNFCVGAWTPAWMPAANIKVANRLNAPYTWMPAGHFPEIICPEKLAEVIKNSTMDPA